MSFLRSSTDCPFCPGGCERCHLDALTEPVPELTVRGIGGMELAAFGGRIMLRSRSELKLIPIAAIDTFTTLTTAGSAFMYIRTGIGGRFDTLLFDDGYAISAATNISGYVASHSVRHKMRVRVTSERDCPNAAYLPMLKKLRDCGHIDTDTYSKCRQRIDSRT